MENLTAEELNNLPKEETTYNKWIRLIYLIICAVCVAIIISHVVLSPVYIDGNSMEPTLMDGDTCYINKFAYLISPPKRYDIVVFAKENTKTTYVKRVYGLPGETIVIDDEGHILINGEVIEDPYGVGDTGTYVDNTPCTLGEGEYFVLGDNREHSADSRQTWMGIGTVKKSEIKGKQAIRFNTKKSH